MEDLPPGWICQEQHIVLLRKRTLLLLLIYSTLLFERGTTFFPILYYSGA